MQDRLKQLMADVFEVPSTSIGELTTQESLPEWTSLAHLRLVTEMESAFGVQVSMEQALGLTSFVALATFLNGSS